ncbi:hypothetical protein [Sphingomonas endolithica]|uniref:hypothetical protein n=1 Tax=Sphingomonas endolithica TaxID=2972485 RepID=UPI0021AE9CCD|nr:hypothetical protein [Sphingomonas sp. ZFBP2030]
MATIVAPARGAVQRDRFFLTTSFAMAFVVLAGFSLQFVMGRSTFAAPVVVHVHAVVFMGWVAIYVLQNVFAASGSLRLHQRLGWIAAGWTIAMVVMGIFVTVRLVRLGHAPFFFTPLQFVVLNPVNIFAFAGLTAAAIVKRRQTEWHRRLHFCGMALLLGPAFGRLLPMPLLIPYAFEVTFLAVMIFPLLGVVHDWRRRGAVHPAFVWGIGVVVGSTALTDAITYSPVGAALYRVVTAGSPGADVAPLAYPPFPDAPLIAGRPASM